MSGEKFTPGPWTVHKRPGIFQITAGDDADAPGFQVICDVHGAATPEGRANAAMLAAAVDMYEALLQVCGDCAKPDSLEDSTVCVSCDIGAALRKVRGEVSVKDVLRPCPSCGGEGEMLHFFMTYKVQCRDCRYSTPEYFTPKKAIDAWRNLEVSCNG